MSTTADEILAADDREPVKVTAWGKTLYLKPMSGTERDAYELEMYADREAGNAQQNFRAKLVVRCLHDAEGNRVFTDDQAEALGRKNSKELVKLFTKSQKMNALSQADVDELAGN